MVVVVRVREGMMIGQGLETSKDATSIAGCLGGGIDGSELDVIGSFDAAGGVTGYLE